MILLLRELDLVSFSERLPFFSLILLNCFLQEGPNSLGILNPGLIKVNEVVKALDAPFA